MESLSGTPKHAERSTGEKCEQRERTDHHHGALTRRAAGSALWERVRGGRGGRGGRVVALGGSRVLDRGRIAPGHSPRETHRARSRRIRPVGLAELAVSAGSDTSIGSVTRRLDRPNRVPGSTRPSRRGRGADRLGRHTVLLGDEHAVGDRKLCRRGFHRGDDCRWLGARRRGCRLGLRHRRGRAGRRLRRRGGSRGSRCGRRRGRRGRCGSGPRREQGQRIDVAFVVPDPDAEVDVRDVVLGIAGRAGPGD
jgi:hypothetical protein